MGAKTILAAVGRLPQNQAVLSRALEVSRGRGARLHVVHVLDLPGSKEELDDLSSFAGQAAFAARDVIKASLRELGADPGTVEIDVRLGAHALCLIDLCRSLSPDLIVMAAHQRRKLSERILGSTTQRVIAAGSTPVLVVKREAAFPLGRVAVATNGTDGAGSLLGYVAALLPEANLRLVQVVDIPRQLKEAMLRTGAGKSALADHRKRLTEAAKAHLSDLASASPARAGQFVYYGDPAATLVRFCHDYEIDLITMGQGRTTLVKRAFIGSVSRRLLRDAPCDVLIH